MFPWVYQPEDCADRTSSDEVKKATREIGEHIILVTMDPFSNRLDIPCLVIHDSAPGHLQRSEVLWKFI